MKTNKIIFLLFVLFAVNLWADIPTADHILDGVQKNISSWGSDIKSVCLWVFFTLAIIDFTWSFGQLALSGNADFGSIITTLIKKILTFGIILYLFNTDWWLKPIIHSFFALNDKIHGATNTVTPDNILVIANGIFMSIIDGAKSLGITSLGRIFLLTFAGLIILIAFVSMTIDLFMAYIKFYLLNVTVFFALALGGIEHFKQTAFNPIMTTLKFGLELFIIQGLMTTCASYFVDMNLTVDKNTTTSEISALLITAVLFSMITKIAPSIVEAIFSGSVGRTSASMAGAGRAMAIAGAGTAGALVGLRNASSGAIGMTKAMQAAKAQHFAEGGAGGMSAIKGTLNNLAQAYKEQQNDAPKGTLGSLAGRMQAKAQTASMDMGSIMDGSAKPSKAKKSSKGAENPSIEAKELSPPKQIPDLNSAGNASSNEADTKLNNAEVPKTNSEASPISAPSTPNVEQNPSLNSSNSNIEQIKGNSSAQEATLNINQDFNVNQAKNSPSSKNNANNASHSGQHNIGNIGNASSGNINKARNFNADATQGFSQNHSTGPIMDDRAMQDINDALAEASNIDPYDPAFSNHQDTFYEDTSYHSGIDIHE